MAGDDALPLVGTPIVVDVIALGPDAVDTPGDVWWARETHTGVTTLGWSTHGALH